VRAVRTRPIRSLFALTALALLAGACSSDDDATGPAEATTIEAGGVEAPDALPQEGAVYAERGPNEVGVHTFALDDGRRVVSWYPADASAADQPLQVFDIASLLSPGLQEQIPAESRPRYEIDARPGAEPATDGPYPVVLFSHGFAGYPEQSANLVTHLASWGFVVVAPDHVERSLSGLLGTASQGVDAREDPEVLSAALDAAVADAERDGSPLADLLDVDRVAVSGHSAGASAAYLTASADERIDAFIAYSIGNRRSPEGEAAERPVPAVPGMVMLGDGDETIPAEASREIYAGMATPKHLVEWREAATSCSPTSASSAKSRVASPASSRRSASSCRRTSSGWPAMDAKRTISIRRSRSAPSTTSAWRSSET
jgi:dienelactone hydrolase